jgi:hypothetical protein
MDKIYLRLKQNISVLVHSGNWSLREGDMIVLQKIGVRTIAINEDHKPTQYETKDCYLTTGFEYKKLVNMSEILNNKADVGIYEMVWEDCNNVDMLMTISYQPPGVPYGASRGPYTYTDIVENFSRFITEWFDDVSVQYNRENKLNFLIDEE